MLKKERDECDFETDVFCFFESWLSFVHRKVLFYRQQPVCMLLFKDLKVASIMEGGQKRI